MTDPFPEIAAAPGWSPVPSDRMDAISGPGIGYSPSSPELAEYWGFESGLMGERSALALSAFFCGVSLISESMGVMPLKVFKERKSGGWDYQDQHPTNYCLYKSNNGWQTPSAFKSMVQSHLLMSGNSISVITRNGRGQGIQLDPYLPINVKFYIGLL